MIRRLLDWLGFPDKSGHNDKDFQCKYWWGDRGGYDLNRERCTICNPKEVSRADAYWS
jgi:hypothetical protein